jgi:hypothetical protein
VQSEAERRGAGVAQIAAFEFRGLSAGLKNRGPQPQRSALRQPRNRDMNEHYKPQTERRGLRYVTSWQVGGEKPDAPASGQREVVCERWQAVTAPMLPDSVM